VSTSSDDFQCKASLLLDNRLVVIIVSATEIYVIINLSGEELPELLLLRRVAVELHPRGISRPLVGHDGIYLVGICGFHARRVFISHDPAIPPKIEILGHLKSSCGLTTSLQQFGTMVLFSYDNHHRIQMATYDLTSRLSHHRWLRLNILEISNIGWT